MTYLTISRILFIAFLVNEALAFTRLTAEERSRMILPHFIALMFLLLFVPLFWALELPAWLGVIAIVVQAAGLVIEVWAEIQLIQAHSFSIMAKTPQQPQKNGIYRFLENPIYVGILLQVAGWSLWMPLLFIAFALQYEGFRRMIREERKYLAAINFIHRGIDSFLWGD